jgi:predicted house-cleaning noncanonical NTP pyrophosphatase (MazG superfamily)
MRAFVLNKLIRDKIFASMQELGQDIEFKKLDAEEYSQALKQKLAEEVSEFLQSEEGSEDELADLLEVIESLAQTLGTDFAALRALQAERREKRGGFEDRIFVRKLRLKDSDPWVQYYAKDPEKFPEENV